MNEMTGYKVLRFDSLANSPTWGKLFSPMVKAENWRKCYGAKSGDVLRHPHLFIFDDEDRAKEWTTNYIHDPEGDTIQIWRVTAYEVTDAPLVLPRSVPLWGAFWEAFDARNLQEFCSKYQDQVTERTLFPALICNVLRLEECVYDFWVEEYRSLIEEVQEAAHA